MKAPAVAASMGIWPALSCVWAVLAIGVSIAIAGLSAESTTRLLVIAFLLGQVALRSTLAGAFPSLAPRLRFVVLGTLLAAVVEGFHMISTPVFLSLRVGKQMSFVQALTDYGLDLLFTVPAYIVIFSVMWMIVTRYRFTLWQYVVVMGLAQALGDGGLFFFASSPAMLVFLPYPMTNYHAINVIPFLATRNREPAPPSVRAFGYLAIPAVIATYLACGAAIKVVGRAWGFE